MSESEHSSSEEDEDYVPEEYDSDEEDSGDEGKNKSCTTKDQARVRRQGGIKLEDFDDNNTKDEKEIIDRELEEEKDILIKQKEIAAKKAKQEELWASFKKDTGVMTQKTSQATPSQMPSSSSSKRVSISKTYDFAGESVTVTKTVDADSTEAKKMKKEETQKTEANPAVKQHGSVGPFKRAGGLSSVLGQISKKPKMSTLEKSKLDWDLFKDQEGINDELQHFNKDGFLEKQAFLQRTDERQFEMERDIRQGTRKR